MKKLKDIALLLVLPYSILMFLFEFIMYRRYIKALHQTVNAFDGFYNMLARMNFSTDFLGRLYSVQLVKDHNIDDDMAYDTMIHTLAPFREQFEQTGIIDVITLRVEEIPDEEKMFLCILEPWNHKRTITSMVKMLTSLFITATVAFYWFFIH